MDQGYVPRAALQKFVSKTGKSVDKVSNSWKHSRVEKLFLHQICNFVSALHKRHTKVAFRLWRGLYVELLTVFPAQLEMGRIAQRYRKEIIVSQNMRTTYWIVPFSESGNKIICLENFLFYSSAWAREIRLGRAPERKTSDTFFIRMLVPVPLP
jgi:hypothetical protein